MDAPTTRFDLVGPVPDGVLAIEASAGTGKTFTLAALATRSIAEIGVLPSELLIVTITRAATSELRDRVRRHLVAAADHLRAADPGPNADPLLDHLRGDDDGVRRQRLGRLERAVTEFDATTITTIHGFATQVLGTLGADAGIDSEATLVDDATERLAEVCADVLAAAAVEGHPAEDLPTVGQLTTITRYRLRMPDLVIEPGPGAGAGTAPTLLVELAERCAATIADRRRRAATLSFDDVLVHLRAALTGPDREAAVATMRSRYRVALIDEFQDTDPVQWDIFRTLFGEASTGTRLVLVGDPKQAIYAFRGADIHTFTEAVTPRPGVANRSLAVNWRSDGALLDALNTLFDGTTFGDGRIAYSPVEPSPGNRDRRLADDRGGDYPPLSIRLALGPDIQRTKQGVLTSDDAGRAVFDDMAAQLVDLLTHARLPGTGTGDGDTNGGRRVLPSDIAVLVRSSVEAADAQQALRRRQIPAVLARGSSVLESPAATQWRWLLEALLRPGDPGRARTFALSWFGGLDPSGVAGLDDGSLGAIQEQLQAWGDTLQTHGVSALVRRVRSESGVAPRVLATADGDRQLTDLDHVAELLQTAAPRGHLGIAGLLAALDTPPDPDIDTDIDGNVAARRVESDEQAVQIMSVWVAKGLEFPIVCCPTLWRHRDGDVIYQEPATGRRVLDAANKAEWPDKASAANRKQLAAREALGENLRLLYVGLTRAQHLTLVWWSKVQGSEKTGLARVLFARADGVIDPDLFAQEKFRPPGDDEALASLGSTLDRAGGTITASVHGRWASPRPWVGRPDLPPAGALEVARLGRTPDRSRHRWSFTAITRRFEVDRFDPYDPTLSDGAAADEQLPGDRGADRDDSPEGAVDAAPRPTPVSAGGRSGPPLSPLSRLPAGPEFGTLVHSVLEKVDFASEELGDQLAVGIARELEKQPFDLTPRDDPAATGETGRALLVAGLHATLETPLGPLFGDRRLRDLTTGDRLDELTFDLLLGGSGHLAGVHDIGRLVVDHLGPDDPLLPWAEGLADGTVDVELAGHLTGSIDAVLRVGGDEPRFVIVDYKTNRLGRRGEVAGPDDYAGPALAQAMAEHDYPLQALLYSVALHRYLRWRLAGYDPARHLGGAAYLFVRGMSGPGVPVRDGHPDGVFSWAVPPGLVTGLSDLLDGRTDEGAPT